MMIGVFILYLCALIAIIAKKRRPALIFGIVGLLSGVLLFWHHVTTKLNINL